MLLLVSCESVVSVMWRMSYWCKSDVLLKKMRRKMTSEEQKSLKHCFVKPSSTHLYVIEYLYLLITLLYMHFRITRVSYSRVSGLYMYLWGRTIFRSNCLITVAICNCCIFNKDKSNTMKYSKLSFITQYWTRSVNSITIVNNTNRCNE